jgi:hypothetical protein
LLHTLTHEDPAAAATLLQKRVWELAEKGGPVEMKALLDKHPEVDEDEYEDGDG